MDVTALDHSVSEQSAVRSLGPRIRFIFFCVTAAIILLADLWTTRINWSLLLIPWAVAIGRLCGVKEVKIFVVAGVAITFLGYFITLDPALAESWRSLMDHRLINRALTAMTIAAIAVISMRIRAVAAELSVSHRLAAGTNPLERDLILGTIDFERRLVVLVFLLLNIAILCFDLLTTIFANLSVLYAWTLLLCVRGQSRRLLWFLMPISLVFSMVPLILAAVHWTLGGLTDPVTFQLYVNRGLSAVSQISIALLVHFWIDAGSSSSMPLLAEDSEA